MRPDQLGQQENQVHRGRRAPQANVAIAVMLDLQGPKVNMAKLARLVPLANVVPKDRPGLQGRQVPKDHLGPKARQAHRRAH